MAEAKDGREVRGTGQEVSLLASSPAPPPGPVIPDWMAEDLASPDAQVRLQAIDRWAQQAPFRSSSARHGRGPEPTPLPYPHGSIDPLIQALEDRDEQVQARALEWIVQDWAREQAAEPPP